MCDFLLRKGVAFTVTDKLMGMLWLRYLNFTGAMIIRHRVVDWIWSRLRSCWVPWALTSFSYTWVWSRRQWSLLTQLLLWVSRNTAVGKMRNCGMRKVKCGIENAEWRWLVKATNHVTAVISADYHTNFSTGNAVKWCLPDSPKLGFRVSVSANRVSANRD